MLARATAGTDAGAVLRREKDYPSPPASEGAERWMHGEYKMPGGKLIVVDLSIDDGSLARVQVSGDFFLEPDSALQAIDAALEGQDAGADEHMLAAAIRAQLAPGVMMYGISPEAVAVAVRRAIDQGTAA
jgi:lipoate-protein ligase A